MRNNLRLNKKAVSNVVATIVTIGITIAAIAILAPIIMDSIKRPMLSPTVSCNEILNSQSIKLKEVCYNSDGEIRIKLERTFESLDPPSITFSLNNNGKERKWECSQNCRDCDILSSGEIKYYYLPVGEELKNAALTLSAGECTLERKEVAMQCSE